MTYGRFLEYLDKDIDAHPSTDNTIIWNILTNLILPVIFVVGLAFLFRRSGNVPGSPGQAMNFGKSRARFNIETRTGVTFDDIAGIEEAKENSKKLIPKGVLLVGSPGTGKTLLAKAIAGEAGVPFFSILVRNLLKSKEMHLVLFLSMNRTLLEDKECRNSGGNDEREQTLNQLLTEMDGFEGNTGIIVVAATNRIDVLDVALLRPGRFDRQITVDLPDLNGRIAILKVIQGIKTSQTVSIETIARRTPGFSGADLANLMNEAAILTARRKKDSIGMAEIDASIDRVIAGMEGRVLTDSKTKRLIAYHEVGHAVVGGRASEEIVFGNLEITTGASNDLQQVTSIARQMVTRFGMSNIGPLSLENQISDPFLGRGLGSGAEYSEDIAVELINRFVLY
eukprot:jgi/Galph1/1568/GphlegSOOS_G240.1